MTIQIDTTILMGTVVVITTIAIATITAVAKLFSRIGTLEGKIETLTSLVNDLNANRY